MSRSSSHYSLIDVIMRERVFDSTQFSRSTLAHCVRDSVLTTTERNSVRGVCVHLMGANPQRKKKKPYGAERKVALSAYTQLGSNIISLESDIRQLVI